MLRSRILPAALLVLGFVQQANAQLSGSYTIGGPGADYGSILAAFQDVEAQGLTGPVDLLVNDGIYTEIWSLDMANFPGLSAVNTITLRSAGSDSSLVTVQYGEPPGLGVTIWEFQNMRHIRFRDITWKHTTADGAELFRINGDMIDVQFTGNAFVAGTSGTDYHIITPFGPLEDVVVEGNRFTGGAEGSVVLGTLLGTKASHDVRVRYNDFTGGWSAVNLGYTVGLAVDSNVFHEAILAVRLYICDSATVRWNTFGTTGNALNAYGIGMNAADACVDVLVEGNTIIASGIDASGFSMSSCLRPRVLDNSFNSTRGFGISMVGSSDPVISGNVITGASYTGIECYNFLGDAFVQDNTVVMDSANQNLGLLMDNQIDTGSTVHITGNRFHSVDDGQGIELLALVGDAGERPLVANNEVNGFSNAAEFECTSIDVVFNSFLSGASATLPVVMDFSTDLRFANNVVSVPVGAPATFIVQMGTAAPDLDHNIYDYDAGSGVWLSDYYADLPIANADGVELGTLLLDPQFVDATTSLMPGNAALLNTGVPFASVPFDILGSPRDPASPTPGAYEDIAAQIPAVDASAHGLHAWPDPVDGYVLLTGVPFAGTMEIFVLAMDGRCLLRRSARDLPALLTGLDQLPPGTLIIRCADEREVRSIRVVKR